jgi:predicted RNA-binding protein with PUA-like domain
MNWLVKEEPTHYNFDTLVKDGKTSWTGVKNPLAQKHLKSMKKGERIFYYHTGDEKAIVGIAMAVSDPYADSRDPAGKLAAIDVAPVRRLARPVTLAAVKADSRFGDFLLVRMSRLSVMPVTDEQWDAIERMAK